MTVRRSPKAANTASHRPLTPLAEQTLSQYEQILRQGLEMYIEARKAFLEIRAQDRQPKPTISQASVEALIELISGVQTMLKTGKSKAAVLASLKAATDLAAHIKGGIQ
jgi:hypothetical protein